MWCNYVNIANLKIKFETKYSISHICKNYKTTKFDNFDLIITATEKQIFNEGKIAEKGTREPYWESTCIYRNLCNELWKFDGFVLHSALFKVDEKGIAFAAKSGTGKSTHMLLWQKLLGDKMIIVNGDKPIIRLIDGKLIAFGTPWQGKENLGQNTSTELTDICFIERSAINYTEKISKDAAFNRIFNQLLLPPSTEGKLKTLALIDTLLNTCNFWIIHCNMELDAAKTACNTLFNIKEKINDTDI